ncbi:hypothetical protein [Marinobacterium stanieri]|uniref:HTH OST-type domain-containing protein n=1 Tax=Marinobacterium stanieri TaxID=49186 RepID=A0A1N6WM81_9GAMM|nr:hypothetical protein [Marinobacterium stanieri]SIQ91118.1 hypothetical protein SAMN05421647_11141 [Marinobacterium stanieri]
MPEDDDQAQAAVHEIQRKVGRNLLMFQEFERLFKVLLIESDISGPAEQLLECREMRKARVHNKTLGYVTSELAQTVYGEESVSEDEDEYPGSLYFRIRITLSGEDSLYQEKQKELHASLVEARNELVHHLFHKFDFKPTAYKQIESYLDEQHERFLPEIDKLQRQLKAVDEARKIQSRVLSSQRYQQFFVDGVPSDETKFEGLMRELCELTRRDDGWMPLATAGKLLRGLPPEKVSKVYDELGVTKISNLKNRIEASQYLELKEETRNGQSTWLYRYKQTLEYDLAYFLEHVPKP